MRFSGRPTAGRDTQKKRARVGSQRSTSCANVRRFRLAGLGNRFADTRGKSIVVCTNGEAVTSHRKLGQKGVPVGSGRSRCISMRLSSRRLGQPVRGGVRPRQGWHVRMEVGQAGRQRADATRGRESDELRRRVAELSAGRAMAREDQTMAAGVNCPPQTRRAGCWRVPRRLSTRARSSQTSRGAAAARRTRPRQTCRRHQTPPAFSRGSPGAAAAAARVATPAAVGGPPVPATRAGRLHRAHRWRVPSRGRNRRGRARPWHGSALRGARSAVAAAGQSLRCRASARRARPAAAAAQRGCTRPGGGCR
mmetsp:Transcript_61075/g.167534  ORF Transcript_61075/g.167534 Transcript_61075/m.167534 type:complete len:308 (+) Transcript_61075:109-1032(+)